MPSLRNLLLIALILLPLAAGCGRGFAAKDSGQLVAAVTIVPHQWLVRQIGGDRVDVVTMVQPGESAELYQPTDAQISRLSRAAAYFRVGMPLEDSRGLRTLLEGGAVKVVDLRDGVPLRKPAGDPHIWLSPRLLKTQARAVAETLAGLDPAHHDEYLRNLADLEGKLDDVDRTIRRTLGPFRGRAFFVYHPAWGYFADEYGLRQVAVETEGKEPGDRELTELQRQARQEGATVIFVPRETAGRAAQALADAIGGRTEVLDDLEYDVPAGLLRAARLLADSFGPERRAQ